MTKTSSMTTPGPFRWGIAGPGGVAAQFAEGMRLVADGEIVAVASRSIERANDYGDRFGVLRRHGSYEDLAADPDIDVVYVATPQSRHAADAGLFLEAGKHVLCEKPMGLDAGQVGRMVEAARDNHRFLMEAMWSRFLPAYRCLDQILAEGRIGEPLLVEADFGFRLPFDPAHRLFDLELGGGALLDLGVYPVQLCTRVLGVPESVVGSGVVGKTGVDEVVAAVLDHPGGRLGVVKAGIRASMACTARITGTTGWIELPSMMHCPQSLTVRSPDGAEEIDASYEGEGLRFQVHEVHRCLAEGRLQSEVMPWAESLAIAGVLDAIRQQLGVVYPAEHGPA